MVHARIAADPAILHRCEHLQQQTIVNVTTDCVNAALVPQSESSGFFGAERHQVIVVPDTVEDEIVTPSEALRDKCFPDAPFDTTSSGAALAVLKPQFVQRQVVHLGVEVGDSVQQHAGLVSVLSVAGERVRFGQRGNASLYAAPYRFEIVVRDDVVPVAPVVEHAVAVVDIELVTRIRRIGMIGVEKQRPVTQFTPEHAVRVQGCHVEGPEVVLRKDLLAVFTPDLPRFCIVELPPFAPRFRRRLLAAAGAVWLLALIDHAFIRVDRPRQLLRGNHFPQRFVRTANPLAGSRNRAFLLLARPSVSGRIRYRVRPHRRADKPASLFRN